MNSAKDVDWLTLRVRAALANEVATELRMFGGTSFMLKGHLLCWVGRRGLMLRVGKEGEAAALEQPFVGPCLETGRPMGGFVMIAIQGVAEDAKLEKWLDVARAYVATLIAKRPVGRSGQPGKGSLRHRTSFGPKANS